MPGPVLLPLFFMGKMQDLFCSEGATLPLAPAVLSLQARTTSKRVPDHAPTGAERSNVCRMLAQGFQEAQVVCHSFHDRKYPGGLLRGGATRVEL